MPRETLKATKVPHKRLKCVNDLQVFKQTLRSQVQLMSVTPLASLAYRTAANTIESHNFHITL